MFSHLRKLDVRRVALTACRTCPRQTGLLSFSTENKETSSDSTSTENSENGSEKVAEGSADSTVSADQALIADLQKQLKEAKDQVIRSYAEEENVRRIARRDVENARTYANTSFAKAMLEVADDLERALSVVPAEKRAATEDPHLKGLIEGIEMTDKNLTKIFAKFGVRKFGEVDDPFDPSLHEALFRLPAGDKKPDTIGQIVKKGYKLNDRVIRAAQVGARVDN